MKVRAFIAAFSGIRQIGKVKVIIPPIESKLSENGIKYISTSFNRQNRPVQVKVGFKNKNKTSVFNRAYCPFDGKDRVFNQGKKCNWIAQNPNFGTILKRYFNKFTNLFR